MSNVTLDISGRKYTIACAPGEEAHIEALGASIDTKLRALNLTGQSAERVLLYAALLLADELHEAKAALPEMPPPAADENEDEETAARLETLADRLETLAMDLETGGAAH